MRITRRKDFLNEDNALFDRSAIEYSIKSNLSGLSDEDLKAVHDMVNSAMKGSGNKKIREEFARMREMDWSEMSPATRRSWLLSINPDLTSTTRGTSFLNMIVNNDWRTAKNNVTNFLESLDVKYIRKISESDQKPIGRDEPKPSYSEPFWLKPKTRKELLDAITKEISNVSLEALNSIYHIVVQSPGVERAETKIDQLISSMEILGDKWDSMDPYLRMEFLVANSPYPVKETGWLKKFYTLVSRKPLVGAIRMVGKMQEHMSDYG